MPSYTYNGVTVTATARRTSTRDDKKYMRTVTRDGKDYLVHYGDPDMEMKRDDSDRRKAFLERHGCRTKRDPLAPGFWACLDWQRTDEGTTVNEHTVEQLTANAKLFSADGEKYTGVMVALFPSPELAQQIVSMPGVDTPADEMHVTLAYAGKVADLTDAQIAGVILAAQAMGQGHSKLTGIISGVGRFNASQSSDGKDVIYAAIDVPGLERFREGVVQMLGYRDVSVMRNHGYTPHMTLAYIDAGADSPIPLMPTTPLTFDSISVAVGGKRVDFPLTGDAPVRANADGDSTACGCNTMQLTTNATAGTVREVTRKGRRYLVAPTVALKSGVLNGEFVPADEVAKFANAWNGRPVPIGHPKQDGQAISANSMDLWDEAPAMFWDAHIDGGALKGNIWLDIDKAAGMGGDGARLLQRLRNNEAIDVSTGYFRDLVDHPGTHDGKEYVGVARNLRPDHIAILLNEAGACSWADGCGVPRINEAKAITASQSFLSALVRNVLRSFGGKKVDREKVIEELVSSEWCKCTRSQLEAMDDETLVAFSESLQSVAGEESPAVKPMQAEVVKEVVPAELAQLAKVVADFGGVDKLAAALSSVVANANNERADLIAGLVANERNTFNEAELKTLPVETLRKIASAFAPRTYVGSGALVATNAGEEPRYVTMAMPSVFPKKEAK